MEKEYGGRDKSMALNVQGEVLNTLGKLGEYQHATEGRRFRHDGPGLLGEHRVWIRAALQGVAYNVAVATREQWDRLIACLIMGGQPIPDLGSIRRVDFGYFVRPPEETGTGQARVEPAFGYIVMRPDSGVLLFDTGMGSAPDVDRHYRPTRRPLAKALGRLGVTTDEVRLVVNCHLHFDHCGGNPELAGRPVFVQASELEAARLSPGYTLPELIDFPGARYERIDGETEIDRGILAVPTPGHTQGHQSLVIRCGDGTVVLAGQSHDTSTAFSADELARRARDEGADQPLPTFPVWMERILGLDPGRVVFAHDQAVWEPAG